MLHCNNGNGKSAVAARDNVSRSWDCILVPMTFRSLSREENNGFSAIFKICHTLDTNA
jgi:hypothetical protein